MGFSWNFEPNIYLLFLKLRKGAVEHDDGSKLVGPICTGQQRWLKPLRLHRAARIGFDPLAMLTEADAIIIYTRNMRKPILYIYIQLYTHHIKLEFDLYYSWEYAGKTNIVYTCSSSTLQYIWSDKSIWSFKSTSATELGHGKSTSARSKENAWVLLFQATHLMTRPAHGCVRLDMPGKQRGNPVSSCQYGGFHKWGYPNNPQQLDDLLMENPLKNRLKRMV